ncbi:MAG: CCA tRNA nucleotidyltransferase, partial [Actinomycetota bacterium]
MRDLMLGRDPYDIDLVTPGPPEPLARKFADSIGGSFFIMSGEFMTCRAISADGLVNYDLAALRGGHIVEDLGERD